jgi:hypothetical protein
VFAVGTRSVSGAMRASYRRSRESLCAIRLCHESVAGGLLEVSVRMRSRSLTIVVFMSASMSGGNGRSLRR